MRIIASVKSNKSFNIRTLPPSVYFGNNTTVILLVTFKKNGKLNILVSHNIIDCSIVCVYLTFIAASKQSYTYTDKYA